MRLPCTSECLLVLNTWLKFVSRYKLTGSVTDVAYLAFITATSIWVCPAIQTCLDLLCSVALQVTQFLQCLCQSECCAQRHVQQAISEYFRFVFTCLHVTFVYNVARLGSCCHSIGCSNFQLRAPRTWHQRGLHVSF